MPFFCGFPDELKNGTFSFYCPEVHKTQTHRMTQSTLVAAKAFLFGAKAPRSGPIFGVSNKNCALDKNKRSDVAIPERGLSSWWQPWAAQWKLKTSHCKTATIGHQCRNTPLDRLKQAGGRNLVVMSVHDITEAEIANRV